jgi:DNA invertase Pin-like site-specific DNA recombinase
VQKQLWEIKRWAKKHNYEIEAEYSDEALSGSDAERPGLWDAIYACKRGYTMLVRTWDRLARDSYLGEVIQQEVNRKGAKIIAVEQSESSHDNPESKLIRTILLALAEYQRQITRARTRAAMRRHQAEGRRMSNREPFGFCRDPKDDRRLVENPYEQKIIARMRELKSQGESLRSIARTLHKEGCEPRLVEKKFKGREVRCKGQWRHQLVKAVLNRESPG